MSVLPRFWLGMQPCGRKNRKCVRTAKGECTSWDALGIPGQHAFFVRRCPIRSFHAIMNISSSGRDPGERPSWRHMRDNSPSKSLGSEPETLQCPRLPYRSDADSPCVRGMASPSPPSLPRTVLGTGLSPSLERLNSKPKLDALTARRAVQQGDIASSSPF